MMSTIILNGKDNWILENDVLKIAISFINGSIDIASVFNKMSNIEYLSGICGRRNRHLFYYNCNYNNIYANDGEWKLEKAEIGDITLYGLTWGKRLVITISRILPSCLQVRLVFEIYNENAGLRYYTFIKNNDSKEQSIINSDIIALNFDYSKHTISYVYDSISWNQTT